jgi:hypothetical protein
MEDILEKRQDISDSLEKKVDFSFLKTFKEKLLSVPKKDLKIFYLKYLLKCREEKVSKEKFLESLLKILPHLFPFEEAFDFAVSIRLDKNLNQYRLYSYCCLTNPFLPNRRI